MISMGGVTMKRLGTAVLLVIVLTQILYPVSSYSQSSQDKVKTEQLLKKMRELKQKKKREQEEAIRRLKARFDPLMKYSIEELQLALAIKVSTKYGGANIYSADDDRTFIGTIEDEFSSESIFNDYGSYGSEYSSTSIWNDYGTYGGEYSSYSPFNSYSSTPPIIVKSGKIIGRLTVNRYVSGAVDPNWLKSYFKY